MNKKYKIITASVSIALAVGGGALAISLNRDTEKVPSVSFESKAELEADEPFGELPENWWESYNYVSSSQGKSGRAEKMLQQNQDIIGWIKINNTPIDYPVVLDPYPIGTPENSEVEPNDYYLYRDIDGSESRAGSLFMDYRDVFGFSETQQSDNLVIYGHNMANNTAFGSLVKYWQNYSFYDESPIIELSSNYKDYQYIIFGYIITSGSYDDTDFHYWNMEDFKSEEDFNFFVDRIQSKSMVDTGVDVKYGDKLLTLSTCYQSEADLRFIVVARRLREHETAMDKIDRTEAYLDKKRQEEVSLAAAEAEAASKAAQ